MSWRRWYWSTFRWPEFDFSATYSTFRWPDLSYFTGGWTADSFRWFDFSIFDDVLWTVIAALESLALTDVLDINRSHIAQRFLNLTSVSIMIYCNGSSHDWIQKSTQYEFSLEYQYAFLQTLLYILLLMYYLLLFLPCDGATF
ncbi:hypothetical protein RJ639_037935 [Escallonia herrerae]|uniref:Uncharacterized protein n=1 Tax=Escallonia herrerae TaxID=1293975 RepID=A0AA88WR63_9ASTE|nr:hypothetical protein RJ639_037935 [Escallonia herrerae]